MPGRTILLAALAAIFFAAPGARAEDVTLTSRDNTIQVTGSLLQYDGEFYRVDTDYGVLTLEAQGVRCDGPGCPDPGAWVAEITISGARTIAEALMPHLIEAFALSRGLAVTKTILDDSHFVYALHDPAAAGAPPLAEITLRASTTDEGFADLIAEEADIALAIRPPTEAERRMAREAGIGDPADPVRAQILGVDALAFVVAPDNPLRSATPDEIAAIFSGTLTSWAALGGPDVPIALYSREPGSGLAQLFAARVLAPRGLRLAPVRRVASNADLSDAVAADPFGIGVTSFAEIGNARALALRGACGIVVVPAAASLKAEEYPFTAALTLHVPQRRLPLIARDLLAWLRSDPAQRILEQAGFVGQNIAETAFESDGARLANAISGAAEDVPLSELQRMVAALRGASRLSAGFRFEDGTATLDPRSRANVARLAEALEAGRYDGREIIFAGFSDSLGPAATNRRLSLERAAAVRRAVLRASPDADLSRVTLAEADLGELVPVACDDSDWGRRLNRRVEVWVR
jgi:phosphate transport system substrate-binding protein